MRLRIATSLAMVVGLVMVGAPLLAHHGTGVAYVRDKEVTLKGTVTEWFWANPHCGLLFDVTDEKGEVIHWAPNLAIRTVCPKPALAGTPLSRGTS